MTEKNNINVGFDPKKKDNPKEYQLIFEVSGKKKDMSYSGTWAGVPFYRLKVKVEKPDEWRHITEIFAFKERMEQNEETEAIWKEILDDDYFDKRKLAICVKYSKSFSLLKWKDRPLGGGAK